MIKKVVACAAVIAGALLYGEYRAKDAIRKHEMFVDMFVLSKEELEAIRNGQS